MHPLIRRPWLLQTSLLPRLPRAAPHNVPPRRIATTSSRNAAPVDIPKLILANGSAHHDSLPSFLDYAKRRSLSPSSSVYIGTHYEYTTALALQRLGFSLLRVGGSYDAGIDLIGHWVLAPLREPLPVIIQCKSRKASLSPSSIREMEGAFQAIPAGWRKKDVLGLLATTNEATNGMTEALKRSRYPMGFVLISREGLIRRFVWNHAATERGLEGVGVGLRHTPRVLMTKAEREAADQGAPKKKRLARFEDSGTMTDIQLTWMGSPISADRDELDPETVKLMRSISSIEPVVKKKSRSRVSKKLLPVTTTKSTTVKVSARLDKRSTVVRTPGKPGRGRPKGSKNKPEEADSHVLNRQIAVDLHHVNNR